MDSSLDTLTKGLSDIHFKLLENHFKSEEIVYCKQKGFFPYNYVDSFERFNETNLPPRSAFYNDLTQSCISPNEYARVEKIWEAFNIKNLGEYSDFYLKVDTCILACCFKRFQSESIKEYDLNPYNYYTRACLAIDAALKVTKQHIELLRGTVVYAQYQGSR